MADGSMHDGSTPGGSISGDSISGGSTHDRSMHDGSISGGSLPGGSISGGSISGGTALAGRIAERRAGSGDPRALVGELRRALVLVPLDGGGLWTGESGGIRWIFGFTDEAALARFAQARAAGTTRTTGAPHTGSDTGRPWEFAELRGARLLDEIVPGMGVPGGVAINVADPDGSMLFPPVAGIVPDSVAVDTGADASRQERA